MSLVRPFAFLLLMSFTAAFAIPQQINYQGHLTNSANVPLDTTVSMTFKLYTDSTAGTLLWTEARPSVTVTSGLFSVRLGQLTALTNTMLNNAQVWLGITIGADAELAPRSRIVSVGYSYRVGTVDGASGGTITGDVNITGKANIGSGNVNSGSFAFVAGQNSAASGTNSVVSGGIYNKARGSYAVVGGGGSGSEADSNSATGNSTFIGGGRRNLASGVVATIAGGEANVSSASRSTVGGGIRNTASNLQATVSGGEDNAASGSHASVGGGGFNYARGAFATVAGGGGDLAADSNSARGDYSTIGGGASNNVAGNYSTICGGYDHTILGDTAFIGGGYSNSAGGRYSVISGGNGNSAQGYASTVPGGKDNITTTASRYGFAAGRRAVANQVGAFVWADSTNADFTSAAINSFSVRASGGYRLYSNASLTSGVTMAAGASGWTNVSDSTLKRNRRNVDTKESLNKVTALPIQQWSYEAQDPSIEHIGPMAQDFWREFHLGDDSLGINQIDPDGIALAAIQELAKRVQELTDQNQRQQAQIQALLADKQQSAHIERKGK